VGLDDAHFYGTYNLAQMSSGMPANAFRIALVHSPELALDIEKQGAALYLTGHTHGGQICLPGGIPIITHVKCFPEMIKGKWRVRNMQGYTSCGLGASGLLVRINCPPEIAIHELRRLESNNE
jgi:predicted MPP superfamily phosphohydrolase